MTNNATQESAAACKPKAGKRCMVCNQVMDRDESAIATINRGVATLYHDRCYKPEASRKPAAGDRLHRVALVALIVFCITSTISLSYWSVTMWSWTRKAQAAVSSLGPTAQQQAEMDEALKQLRGGG